MFAPFYLLSIASCLLLAGIHTARGQWEIATLLYLVAALYAGRGVMRWRQGVRERRDEAVARQGTRGSSEVRASLMATRDRTRVVRQKRVLLGFCILIAATLVVPQNAMLAFAMSVFLLPLVYLILRDSQVIWEIDRGLATS